MIPSASTLIVASTRSWRACADAMRFSRRSSVHLTVALSMCAAMTMVISSRPTNDFRPKPPPTSPICTRTLFSGTPVAARERQARFVRVLARVPHVEALVVRLPSCGHHAALHRHHAVAVLHEALRHLVGGAVERLATLVAQRDRHLHEHVVRTVRVDEVVAHERGVVGEDRGTRLVVDLHELGRVFREVAALGDDQRDRIADEAHVVDRQREHRRHELFRALEHRRVHRDRARAG